MEHAMGGGEKEEEAGGGMWPGECERGKRD
jgi:hypothetical protein